jgi:hypothetical protein
MMVWGVSLDDQETFFQTPHGASFVSTVPVRLEQAPRGSIDSITSTNRILNPPESIRISRSLNSGNGVFPDFEVQAGQDENDGNRNQ